MCNVMDAEDMFGEDVFVYFRLSIFLSFLSFCNSMCNVMGWRTCLGKTHPPDTSGLSHWSAAKYPEASHLIEPAHIQKI